MTYYILYRLHYLAMATSLSCNRDIFTHNSDLLSRYAKLIILLYSDLLSIATYYFIGSSRYGMALNIAI